MQKGIIYKNIFEAQEANHQEALNRGCSGATSYWYPMKELTDETTLPKAEYAELMGIPATITLQETEVAEEQEIENTKYKELPLKVKVKKYAMVVGDDKDEIDEDGNKVVPAEVVDISSKLPVKEEV